MTEVVSDGESSILAMVSAMEIESSTKYDLFDASQMAFQVRTAILTKSVASTQELTHKLKSSL